MPQISAAFNGWMQLVRLMKHKETVTDGQVFINEQVISFYGVIQPLGARALELKPEGQRSWQWLQIHSKSRATNLIPGDKIGYNGDLYKVMERYDYDLNGFVEFHCVRDYQTGGSQ